MRFAGLGGYLMAKAAAVASRGFPRDFYDLAFVLLFNRAGGPRQAAAELLSGPARTQLPFYERQLRAAIRLFTDDDRAGARHYADEMGATGHDADYDTLVEDAASAAAEFWSVLEADAG